MKHAAQLSQDYGNVAGAVQDLVQASYSSQLSIKELTDDHLVRPTLSFKLHIRLTFKIRLRSDFQQMAVKLRDSKTVSIWPTRSN